MVLQRIGNIKRVLSGKTAANNEEAKLDLAAPDSGMAAGDV